MIHPDHYSSLRRHREPVIAVTGFAKYYMMPFISHLQGTVSGYTQGGFTTDAVNVIDKFSFHVDQNATDVGDLALTRYGVAGHASMTRGYSSGGFLNSASSFIQNNSIDKFSFHVDQNATDVGDLTTSRGYGSGHSSKTHGYTSGGYQSSPSATSNVIDKFFFHVDQNATDVGDLATARNAGAGVSSDTHGYNCGGRDASGFPIAGKVDRFSFYTDQNAVQVSTLSNQNLFFLAGVSSKSKGFILGGVNITPTYSTSVHEFRFYTDSNVVITYSLTTARSRASGSSSHSHGYAAGGYNGSNLNVIDKIAFSTSSLSGTDVGDLTVARRSVSGTQF